MDGIEMPLALRHSNIMVNDDASVSLGLNRMCYKCPNCGWFITFMVTESSCYLKRILEDVRKGNNLFVPTTDDWSEESDLIKKQLEGLGYWGG
jgi:hypothetical protein